MNSEAGSPRVLVLEDETLLCWTIVRRLENERYGVVAAKSCREAREAFRRTEFDGVVADYRLEDGMSTKVIGEMNAEGKHPAVILMTGELEQVDPAGPEFAGITAFLPKPLDLDMLVDRLRPLLSGKKEVTELPLGAEPERVGGFQIVRVRSTDDIRTFLATAEAPPDGDLLAAFLLGGAEAPSDFAEWVGLLKTLVRPGRRFCVVSKGGKESVLADLCENAEIDLFGSLDELENAARRLFSASERKAVLSVSREG